MVALGQWSTNDSGRAELVGAWGGIEIKLGHNLADRAAASILRVRDKVVAAGARPPSFLAVVEGLGTHAYTRADGVHVVPIQTLCP